MPGRSRTRAQARPRAPSRRRCCTRICATISGSGIPSSRPAGGEEAVQERRSGGIQPAHRRLEIALRIPEKESRRMIDSSQTSLTATSDRREREPLEWPNGGRARGGADGSGRRGTQHVGAESVVGGKGTREPACRKRMHFVSAIRRRTLFGEARVCRRRAPTASSECPTRECESKRVTDLDGILYRHRQPRGNDRGPKRQCLSAALVLKHRGKSAAMEAVDFGAGIGTFARMVREHGISVRCIELDIRRNAPGFANRA